MQISKEQITEPMNQEKLPTITIPFLSMEALENTVERVLRRVLGENQDKPDETLLTTEEVCKKFHVSRVTLNNYRRERKLIPTSKAGKQFVYRMCDCIEALRHRLKVI